MLELMSWGEKKAYVETLPRVINAPEEVLTGFRGSRNRRLSKTASGSKEAERRWYMGKDFVRIGEHVVAFDRPGIDRTVYYDDEYPDPLRGGEDKRKANWMAYNLRFKFRHKEAFDAMKHDGKYFFHAYKVRPFAYKSYDETSYIVWNADENDAQRYPEENRRYLTDDELDQIRDIFEELERQYVKRLESYWKRFKDKIYSYGYWANR